MRTTLSLDDDVFAVARQRAQRERTSLGEAVSRYVRELKDGKHEGRHLTCAKEAWAREITEEDMYLRFFKLALLGSSATFIDAIAAARPVSADIGAPISDGMRKARRVSPARIKEGLREIAPGAVVAEHLVAARLLDHGSQGPGAGNLHLEDAVIALGPLLQRVEVLGQQRASASVVDSRSVGQSPPGRL